MKSTTQQTILFAIALTMFLCGLCTASSHAAAAAQTEGRDLGTLHAAADVACAECHGETEKTAEVSMMRCLECHGETTELAERTADVKPVNPHQNRHYGTEADCNLCHHQHKKSENFCFPCHNRFDFMVP